MSTFERIDLTPFAHLFGSKWYEDVDGYDEDGFLEHPEPNGEVYSGEYGAHIATVHLRGATDAVVNTPHFLAALRFAYTEIDRLRACALEWVTVTDDPTTLPEEHVNVLILRAEYDGDPDYMPQCALLPSHEFPEWHSDFDGDVKVVPGDRWTYIPEVTS